MEQLVGDRYAIERRIGEGGMAEVLLARDNQGGGRQVVVKRCRAHLKHQPEFATLFLREARLASLVHHPNVVEVEGTGEDDGQPYLVMEYLQGFTVRDIYVRATTEGPIPQDIAAAIILGAARGLAAAHSAVDERGRPIGLVHRDVSPHNLFLTDHGVVKVLDFGIAKGAGDVTMTRAGHVKGKASYLAPEQLKQPPRLDARTDLFSLGTVAWELFTARRLFRRATETDTINAIRTLQVPDPKSIRPEIDPEYASVVMRLLAREPDDRPANASEVVAVLEAALKRRARIESEELTRFVAHIREIAPVEERAASIPPPPPDKEQRQREYEEAWGTASQRRSSRPPPLPPEAQEPTATLAPPTAASWVSATGEKASADGSVVGTWAVAGAPRVSAE